MTAQSIHADQVGFQDTTADRPNTDGPNTDGLSLLPGFIGFYQDAQRIKRETRQVYAMNDAQLHDAGMSSHEDIPRTGLECTAKT
jgi:hypothetical protein